MGLSFSKWLIIAEVFNLDFGKVLTLAEALDLSPEAQERINVTKASYAPGPHTGDHLVAAVLGLKPAALLRYEHHPENPAASIVSDAIKKGDSGRVQAELLSHGIKVRPDFNIIYMNLPGYSKSQIIVGGKAATEELWKVYQCQYNLDFLSSGDHSEVTPEIMGRVNKMMHGRCEVFCKRGEAGMNCIPIHKRIGELLGYTDEQVDGFLNDMKKVGGYNHMPDVEYPVELPTSLAASPRKKGFKPYESTNYLIRHRII